MLEVFLVRKYLFDPAQDCLYVDDRRKNLGAAQAVGMDAVLFNSRHVPYDGKTVESFRKLTELLGMGGS